MAVYEVQATHVRWWRGQPKRWTTRWTYSGSWTGSATDLDTFASALRDLCYSPSATPNAYGGLAEVQLYNRTTGGVPVATRIYFPWQTSASWIGYTSGAWASRTTQLEAGGEIALQVYFPAGVGKTGKPVRYRKWIHAVPASDPSSGAVQLTTAQQLAISNQCTVIQGSLVSKGLAFGDGVRIPGTAVALPYYGAHQMVRGRRKKVLTSAQQQSLLQQAINAGIDQTSSQPGLA